MPRGLCLSCRGHRSRVDLRIVLKRYQVPVFLTWISKVFWGPVSAVKLSIMLQSKRVIKTIGQVRGLQKKRSQLLLCLFCKVQKEEFDGLYQVFIKYKQYNRPWMNQLIYYKMNFNQSNIPLQNNHYGAGGISPSNVKRDKSFKQLSPDCNSIEVYSNQGKSAANGGDRVSIYKNQPSRQNYTHPSASTQCQKDQHPHQGMNDLSVNSSIVNTASNVNIGKGPQMNGRSPVVGTRLGKIIMAAKGQSQGRSNFFMMQPQSHLAYENNLVDDFELMKNVQNLIEENAHRCISQNYTSTQVGSHTSASISDNHYLPHQVTSDHSFKFANFMKASEASPSTTGVNLFSSAFEPIKHVSSRLQQEVLKQKSSLNHNTNNNQSPTYVDQIQIKQQQQNAYQQMNPPPRKTNVFRLVHNNNNKYAKIRNEIDQMLNMHHQRYSSASPQQQQQAATAIFDERNKYVQEYLNDNLFTQINHPITNSKAIHAQRFLRFSQETNNQDVQSQDETSFFHQASDQHTLFDNNNRLFDISDGLSAPVRILDAQGLLMLQKQKHVKSVQKQSQNKLVPGVQKKNPQQQQPISLYHQMNNKSKNRIQMDNPQQQIGLQLIGSQFQTKINPEQYIMQGIKDQRRASNEGIANYNTKELLLMLKRRQLEQTQLTADDIAIHGYQGDESLFNENDLDKSGAFVQEQNEIRLLRQSIKIDQKEESRQPQVSQQKSERIFNTQKPRGKVLSQPTGTTIKKGAHNTFSSREQKTMLNQLKNQNNSAINSRTKLKSLLDKTDSNQVVQTTTQVADGETTQNDGGGIGDLNKKSTNRIIRPQKKNLLNQLFPMQIETEEEKIERILKFQKQIKAKYNDISLTQNFKDEPYRYIVIRGNNSDLVKRCLEDRQGDWLEISNKNTLFNFKWAPFSKGIRFDYLTGHGMKKMVNHFEFHDQISEKDNLFFNMQRFCENTAKKNVFDQLPVTFSVSLDNKNYIDEIERFQSYFRILERSKAIGNNPQERLNQVNKEISNYLLFNSKVKNYTKYTLCENMFDGNNLWLLKPTDYNRGRGVQVFNSIEQFRKLLHELQQGMEVKFAAEPQPKNNMKSPDLALKKVPLPPIQNSTQQLIQSQSTNQPADVVLANFTNLDNLPNIVKTNNFVIQKYLEKPLLIKKRKFDIRLWVLVTHEYKCFLFKEGYIRTSSYEYDTSPESLDKPFIHLTNNAVQKFNENYGAFEEGNQLSLEKGTEFLKQDGIECDLNKLMKEGILEIIKDTLKCVDGRLNSQNRKFCMEIFGYDFIIDSCLKPWLIEVNTNPCLEESSSLLKVLIPRMLDDALKLTLDQVFPPKRLKPTQLINPVTVDQHRTLQSPKEEELPINFVICSEPGLGSGPQVTNFGETAAAQQSFVRSAPSQLKAQQQSTIDSHAKTPKNASKKISETSTMMSTSHNQQTGEVAGVKEHNTQGNPEVNGGQPSKYGVPGYSNFENMWEFIYQYKI